MRVYVCVDDTDDLTKSISTGTISELIANAIIDMGGVMDKGITRHQLLLHEDIEYTSHNSSMCFVVDIEGVEIAEMKSAAEKILLEKMAESSDPGLCFCRLDELKYPDKLIAFGKRAQREVLYKDEAYKLAEEVGGTVLQEYGGTGIGVIGALAGVGLRISGCDGTFRGGKNTEDLQAKVITAKEWKEILNVDQILDIEGNEISDEQKVRFGKQAKTALLDHKVTVIVRKEGDEYITCSKKEMFDGDKLIIEWNTSCDDFELDNDLEECLGDTENACYNCLYRRWTAKGYICTK